MKRTENKTCVGSIRAVAPMNFRMLRLAREMREMSQTRLARESGVSQAVVSRIEGDVRPPTGSELERLASALGFPTEFFYEVDSPAAAPMFRKRTIRSVTANRKIQARINTAVLAAKRLLDAGVEIETQFAFPEPGEVSEDPKSASAEIRAAWGLPAGRVDNVTALIEGAGGIVLHVDLDSDAVSAAFVSSLGDSRLWFIVNTRETSGDRVRLSLAHELGHAILHRYLPVRDEGLHEGQAYEFASTFLLPPKEFNASIGPDLHLRRARDLKRTYWVSIQAIVRASRDRGLITQDRYTSLYKQISARGWRLDEPESLPVELPTIWPAVLDVHRERHGYSDEDMARIAKLSVADLSSLFPLQFRRRFQVIEGGNYKFPTVSPLGDGVS